MADTVVLRKVPKDQVDDKIKKFKRLGATKIDQKNEADGTVTLTISFP